MKSHSTPSLVTVAHHLHKLPSYKLMKKEHQSKNNGKKAFFSDKFTFIECQFLKEGRGACGWELETGV